MTTHHLTKLIDLAKKAGREKALDAADLKRLGDLASGAEQELRHLTREKDNLEVKVKSLKSQAGSSSSRGLPGFHGPRRERA